jgi:mRNA interferase RelE/StbE
VTCPVTWTDRALRDADRLDHRPRERVFAAVERFAATGRGDVKRLQGRDGESRSRVGDVRVFFRYGADTGVITITVRRALPRDRAYRD